MFVSCTPDFLLPAWSSTFWRCRHPSIRGRTSRRWDLLIILLVIVLVLMLGAAPAWPYSRSWGYYPSGGLGLILIILLVLLVMGR